MKIYEDVQFFLDESTLIMHFAKQNEMTIR